MIIAVTGHRPNKLWGYDYWTPKYIELGRKLRQILIDYSPDFIISGMALGVDTVFAMVGLKLGIPLECAIPCQGQDSQWIKESQDLYKSILSRAQKITFVSDQPYHPSLMQLRNQYMVDSCDLLIAVWDGTSGGTANCVRYAQSKNKQIIFINPKEI